MLTQAYGPHPLLRAASPYVPVGPYYGGGPPPTQPLPVPQLSGGYPNAPPGVPQGPPSGGYTLPPTAAYFPVTAYTNNTTQNACVDNTQQVMMSQDSLNLQQPNTPDLLMHRRAVSLHKGPNWAVDTGPKLGSGYCVIQCGNFRIFLPLIFYVKSKLMIIEVQKLPFNTIGGSEF